MFLDSYMEDYIIRRAYIINSFYKKKEINLEIISRHFNVSIYTIRNDLKILEIIAFNNLETVKFIKIKENILVCENLSQEKLEYILSMLYSESSFLKILTFFLYEKSDKEKYLYDHLYLSKSKYYEERKKVISLIEESKFTLNKNEILGDPFRIIWFKACLNVFYNIRKINSKDKAFNIIDDFVNNINLFPNCYYTIQQKEILLNLLAIMLENNEEIELNSNLKIILNNFELPVFLEKEITNLVVRDIPALNKNLKCIRLILFFLNNHTFSPEIKNDWKNYVEKKFMENYYTVDLLNRLENQLDVEILNNRAIFQSIYNQLKLYLAKQYLYPSNIHDYYQFSNVCKKTKNKIYEILIKWGEDNNLVLNIDFFNIEKLTHDILEFKQSNTNSRIFICTDTWDVYLFTYRKLKKNLKLKVDIVDAWINTNSLTKEEFNTELDIIIQVGRTPVSIKNYNRIYIPNIYSNTINWDELNKRILEQII